MPEISEDELEELLTAAWFGVHQMDDLTHTLMQNDEYDEYHGPIFDAVYTGKVLRSIENQHDLDLEPSYDDYEYTVAKEEGE